MSRPSISRSTAWLSLLVMASACHGEPRKVQASAAETPPSAASQPTPAVTGEVTPDEQKLDPDIEERLRVGIALIRSEKFDEAQAWFEKMSRERGDAPAAHYNLGWLHDRSGRLKEAIQSYEKAIELDPKHPRAYNNLGYTLQKAGRFDEAIDTWIEGIARVPDNRYARNNLKKLIEELRCAE